MIYPEYLSFLINFSKPPQYTPDSPGPSQTNMPPVLPSLQPPQQPSWNNNVYFVAVIRLLVVVVVGVSYLLRSSFDIRDGPMALLRFPVSFPLIH